MRFLLTGAGGFLGRQFAARYSNEGGGLLVSRNTANGVRTGSWNWVKRELVLGENRFNRAVDAVIHLEVKQHVLNPRASDIADFQRVNVEGTKTWLDWCSRNDITKFIYFSSIKAVQPTAGQPTVESLNRPNPSPYGASKWAAEQEVRLWASVDSRRSALILRPAVVYGAGNTANMATMIAAIRKGRFFLVGPSDNIKSVISVGNLVAATLHLAQRMESGTCEVYNLTDAQSLTVREIDARIRAKMGKRGNSPTLPLKLARFAGNCGDIFHRVSGLKFPIDSYMLNALLEASDFSCEKLLRTGFRHPEESLSKFD